MNIPVTLPIFIHTDETASLKSLGIAIDIAECEVREMVFFNINAISAYTDDRYDLPSPFSEVHANGSDYICAMSIDKLKQKLGV
mgnify:FL=1